MAGKGEKKKEPMSDPAGFFHMHQENSAVSALDGAKQPQAFLNASVCQICCVDLTTSHVSFWLPQYCA